MPNRYKVELTVVDKYEELEEEPLDLEDIKNEVTLDPDCGLEIEGEIKVTKVEE